MRDAFLDHLRGYPFEHKELVQRRPHVSLEVSYVRGSKENPIEDRFDYLFVSEGIDVKDCSYDYQGATAAGGDRGIVTVEFRLRR